MTRAALVAASFALLVSVGCNHEAPFTPAPAAYTPPSKWPTDNIPRTLSWHLPASTCEPQAPPNPIPEHHEGVFDDTVFFPDVVNPTLIYSVGYWRLTDSTRLRAEFHLEFHQDVRAWKLCRWAVVP